MKILVVSLVRTFAHLWHGKLYMFQFCTGYIEGVILPWTFHLILPCKMNRLIRREALLSSWKITKDSTASIYVFLILYQKKKISCGENFEGMPKEPFWSPTKKRAVTWWIGAGYRALRTLSVAFLVGFESDGQGFGFWCEFFGTLDPTEPGKCKIEVEEQSPHSSYLFNFKDCSKPFLSNGEVVSLFALAVLPGVSHVKCWAGHHQGGTGTHLLQHVSCKCSYNLDVLGFRNDLVDYNQQNSESCQMGEGSLLVGLIQKQIVEDFWQI